MCGLSGRTGSQESSCLHPRLPLRLATVQSRELSPELWGVSQVSSRVGSWELGARPHYSSRLPSSHQLTTAAWQLYKSRSSAEHSSTRRLSRKEAGPAHRRGPSAARLPGSSFHHLPPRGEVKRPHLCRLHLLSPGSPFPGACTGPVQSSVGTGSPSWILGTRNVLRGRSGADRLPARPPAGQLPGLDPLLRTLPRP